MSENVDLRHCRSGRVSVVEITARTSWGAQITGTATLSGPEEEAVPSDTVWPVSGLIVVGDREWVRDWTVQGCSREFAVVMATGTITGAVFGCMALSPNLGEWREI